eukprot:gene20660-27446_t
MAPRLLLIPVDDTDDSQKSFDWVLSNLFKDKDEVHLVHVIPRIAFGAAAYALPAVDYTPGIDRDKYEAAVRKAEDFIVRRFLSRFGADVETTPIVHIVKSETDSESVGHIVCAKAAELDANCVLMGSHDKGHIKEFFMGSVSRYVAHHCKMPVVIVRNIC